MPREGQVFLKTFGFLRKNHGAHGFKCRSSGLFEVLEDLPSHRFSIALFEVKILHWNGSVFHDHEENNYRRRRKLHNLGLLACIDPEFLAKFHEEFELLVFLHVGFDVIPIFLSPFVVSTELQ